MITIYDRYETSFTTNGIGIIELINPSITEELNGIFKLTGTYPLNGRLSAFVDVGATLRADTPEGEQPFRIWSITEQNDDILITAYHISFDLYYKIVEDKNLVTLGGQAALTRLLEDTPFTALSDVTTSASARIIRKTVQGAIFDTGTENSFINRWGGEFVRDKYTINAKNRRGRMYSANPVSIRYGKNLVSYESDIDESTYYNRILPVGFNGLLLPEKYVDRTGIDLNDIRFKIVEYNTIKAIENPDAPQEDEVPLATAEQMLRDAVSADFTAGTFDPKINHRVSFVELSTTVEYENVAVLERLYLGDEVKVINSSGVDVMARVISYTYDPDLKEYKEIQLGNYQEKPMSLISQIDVISKTINEISTRQLTESHVTSLITSAMGGYVKEINGEMYIMDTEDPLTAQKVWRWNINGLGYSSTGVNGTYTTAITMDGHIVGAFIQANSIVANSLSADVGQSLDLSSNTSVNTIVTTAISNDTTKEPAIIKQTTAPAHLAGRLWIDTSVTPNILKRSTGTSWVNASYTSDDIVTVVRNNANYTADLAAAAAARDTKLLKALMEPVKAGHADLLSRMSDLPTDDALLNTAASEELSAYNILQTTFDTVVGNGVIDTEEWTSFDDALAAYQIKESALATAISKATFKITGVLQTRVTAAEEKITADSIINTITSSEVWETTLAGKLNATDLAAGVDNILVEKSYVSKSTVDGQIDTLTSSITAAGETIKDLQTTFTKDINGLSIASGLGSTMELGSSSIRFLMAGQDTYSWDKGVFYTKDVQVTGSIQIGNHKIEKNGTEGTIFVPMGGM